MLTIMFFACLFQPSDWSDLTAVIAWLAAGPGAVALAMWLIGFVAESFPGWHNLPYFVKRYLPLVLAAIFSVLANLVLARPDIIAMIQPWWAIVVMVIIGWTAALVGHSKANVWGVSDRAKARARLR